jgi:glycosyltransferase involved in cell wall biosynthesis
MYYSKITILIPCYNVEKYIYKCLNSLVQQNDKNFNLILINDGSTDTTLSIMQEFEKKYSKLMSIQIFSQENVGLVETRKRLVKLCKTKYFVFIDSDD